MDDVVLKIEHLTKIYQLGEIGTGTLSHDINRWWAKMRGKEDPFLKVGVSNDRTQKAQKGELVKVLDDINFEVKRGEVLGIIGKNGAGKSTLLKVISQITSPTSGTIKAKGRIASLLEVGTGMHPEMTGRENVYLNGTILGMTKKEIDSKYDEIMDFAGCSKYAETPVKRYSSGMKVRLGFAVAAFLEPEILIVDEVLAVGDAEFQKKAIGKMQDISKGGGRTVLFVSHNMGSVSLLCNRSILLENGRVSFIGNTKETIQQYLSSAKVNSEFKRDKSLGEINSIEHFFVGDRNEAKDEILFNDEIVFSWKINFEDLPGLTLGFHIKTPEDVIVLADEIILSKENKKELNYLLPKTFLMPGEYFVNTALHIPNQMVYDKLYDKIGFNIVDSGSKRSKYNSNSFKIIVNSPGKWD
jgi:lipopolysaccharide transport system ATP-binding protein